MLSRTVWMRGCDFRVIFCHHHHHHQNWWMLRQLNGLTEAPSLLRYKYCIYVCSNGSLRLATLLFQTVFYGFQSKPARYRAMRRGVALKSPLHERDFGFYYDD